MELLTNWIRGPIMLVLFFFELGEYFIFYIFFSNLVSFSAHVVFSFYSFNVSFAFFSIINLWTTCGIFRKNSSCLTIYFTAVLNHLLVMEPTKIEAGVSIDFSLSLQNKAKILTTKKAKINKVKGYSL